jgi:hypothetical protein
MATISIAVAGFSLVSALLLFCAYAFLIDAAAAAGPLGTAMGVAALVSYAGGVPDSPVGAVVLGLPLLATAHILFLARNLLCHCSLGSDSDA